MSSRTCLKPKCNPATLKLKGRAVGDGVTLTALSSGADERLATFGDIEIVTDGKPQPT